MNEKTDENSEENTDESVDLQEHLDELEEATQSISLAHRDMKTFLRDYVEKFYDRNEEVALVLGTEYSQDALADIYQTLMDELDNADAWDIDDVLEGAAVFVLMGIGMRATPDDPQSDDS